MKHKPTILIVNHGVFPASYARVIKSIFEHLSDMFDIHHFCVNYRGEPLHQPWRVYPNPDATDFYGTGCLPRIMDEVRPELLFIMGDPWLYSANHDYLSSAEHSAKIVYYYPVDGFQEYQAPVERLASLDQLIVFTKFAQQEIDAIFGRLSTGDSLPPQHILPHGVDTETFRPLIMANGQPDFQASRNAARERLFPGQALENAFIVFNGNRNTARKRLDITLEAFARFAHRKPSHIKLCLLHISEWNNKLWQLAERYKIRERIIPVGNHEGYISDKQLNLLYNACDVGVNSSIGEGWGMISFEHAATGAAQIVPGHSACAELWQEAGIVIRPAESVTKIGVIYQVISPVAIAETLNNLYRDKNFRQERAQAAFCYATSPQFQWSNIAQKMRHILYETIEAPIQ